MEVLILDARVEICRMMVRIICLQHAYAQIEIICAAELSVLL